MSYGIEREKERLDLGKVIVRKRERKISRLWRGCPNMVSKCVCRSRRPTLAQLLKGKKGGGFQN